MELTAILSWVGFSTGLFIGIPQIIKTIKRKSAEDVSEVTFALIVVTASCFLIRMLVLKELAFICYYSFIIISATIQLYLIWRFRAK